MTQNAKLREVMEILKKEGSNEEQIQKVLEEITKVATAKMQAEMIANLKEEDFAEIEKCTSQEEANVEIRQRFAERSGKNPDEIMQEFLTTFADGFLQKYNEDKKSVRQAQDKQ